ncbi:MAG: conjugal transfer protein TrbL family protein [Candidatus Dormibacteria bacterium]|jgi:hypothetical protein
MRAHVMLASLNPLSSLGGLIASLLSQFVNSGRKDILSLLNGYLFTTVDTSRPGSLPLTSNPHLAAFNGDFSLAGDALLVLVVLAVFVRSILDRSVTSTHDLKAALPRVLLAVFLMHASLSLMQGAIDLNNSLSTFAQSLGGGSMPWTNPLDPSSLQQASLAADLFKIVVVLALVVAVVILALAYVVRMAVLQVLIAVAPLAALATILPETRGLAQTWARLFGVALFMQAAQITVLRVATATGLAGGSSLAATLYALATLWVALKVPQVLASAARQGGAFSAVSRELGRQARRTSLTLRPGST